MFELREEDSSYKESHISSQQVKFTADLLRATQVLDPPPPGEVSTHQQEQKSEYPHISECPVPGHLIPPPPSSAGKESSCLKSVQQRP